MLLQRFDYNICTARDADEAIELGSVVLTTLIICDLPLTGRNGLDLLQQMKETPRTSQGPAVIKTADLSPEVERKYPGAGAVLLRQPVQAHDPYRIIQLAIEKIPRKHIRICRRLPVMAKYKPLDCGGEGECPNVLSPHAVYVRSLKPSSMSSNLSQKIVVKKRTIPKHSCGSAKARSRSREWASSSPAMRPEV